MVKTDERQRIRDAMDRLLLGSPIRSSGALNVVTLAEEADVKRHYLTHKHTDLREEFYARVKAQGKVPESEIVLRSQLVELNTLTARLKEEKKSLEGEVAILRRMVNVLELEKARAETALNQVLDGRVTPIRGG